MVVTNSTAPFVTAVNGALMEDQSRLLQPTGHIREGCQEGAISRDQRHAKLLGGCHEFAVISAAAAGGHELKHSPKLTDSS